MFVILRSLLLIALLTSCGTTEESRYRDTDALERPPRLGNTNPTPEQRVVDTSSIPKRDDKPGLGAEVYLVSNTQFNIKQPYEETWNIVNRGLKQAGIKITDHEYNKGRIFVSYDTRGFFERLGSILSNDAAIYLLTIEQIDNEDTSVAVSIANPAEQTAADEQGVPHPTQEGAEDILQQLFGTLRDRLEEE